MNNVTIRKCLLLVILILTDFSITWSQSVDQHFQLNNRTDLRASLDSSGVEVFFDSLIASEMEKMHIPGVSILIVQDSSILFSKGYGYANLEENTPVLPSKTVFYAGSVSKLFTATAIMQLNEQGKLTLDANVNQYLSGFKIDENFPEGVTIENLLTHTGGFEEKSIGLAALSRDEILPLEEFLSSGKQPRVLPPGKYLSYSNYGYTMLGYLVEIISGIPYPQYIEQNILAPLGMQNSSFSYREDVFSELAFAYLYRKGEYTKMPHVFLNVGPAGALLSTPTDLSKFMIAHLHGGNYFGREILQPETASLMHSRLFSQHPLLEGWCHGFYERQVNNEKLIEHAGDIAGFSSLLSLLPERKLGLFVCYNGGEGMALGFRKKVVEQFVDRFFPAEAYVEEPSIETVKNLNKYAGTYRMNRYPRLSIEKLSGIIMEARIKVLDEGSLSFRVMDFLNIPASRWIQVEPLLFRNPVNNRYMAFYENGNGKITHMNLHMGTPANFEKIQWYGTGRFHLILVLFFLVVYLIIYPGWAIRKLILRLRNKSTSSPGIPGLKTRGLALLVSSLNLFFLVGFIGSLVVLGQKMAFGIPWIINFFLGIPIISVICSLALVYLGIIKWHAEWKISGRVQFITLILTTIAFILFLNFWNLLGFNY